MTKNKSISKDARRKLLKNIAAGSGAVVVGKSLPDSWSRPIVDSVMLPAHAQTSGLFAGSSLGVVQLSGGNLLAGLVSNLVPEAEAGPIIEEPIFSPTSMDVSYCFSFNDARTQADVDIIITAYGIFGEECSMNFLTRTPNVDVGGSPVEISEPEPEQFGCGELRLGWNNLLNGPTGQSLLASMGLINDASAGQIGMELPMIQITSVGESVIGRFTFFGLTDDFIIGLGSCETYSPLCTEGCLEIGPPPDQGGN